MSNVNCYTHFVYVHFAATAPLRDVIYTTPSRRRLLTLTSDGSNEIPNPLVEPEIKFSPMADQIDPWVLFPVERTTLFISSTIMQQFI